MNLFRSEEHVRSWSGYIPETEAGIIQLPDMVEIFAGSLFTRRPDPDYVSNMQAYMLEFVRAVQGRGPFWQLPR